MGALAAAVPGQMVRWVEEDGIVKSKEVLAWRLIGETERVEPVIWCCGNTQNAVSHVGVKHKAKKLSVGG